MTNDSNKHHEQVIEPECHAQGIIWVGDTSQSDSIQRLQNEFDAIGNIMPAFEITGFDNFDRHILNEYFYPENITLYQHWWKEQTPERHLQRTSSIAFDQTTLRMRVPVNWHCTSDLCLRYKQDDDGVKPDWESPHQYFSVMCLSDLEQNHMLAKTDSREESAVALIEHRSGLVLPLPDHAAVSWMYYGDGAGVEVSVYDGKSLRWQMETYPEYFNPDIFLNEDDVELDISNCLNLLEQIQQGFINPRSITEHNLPPCQVRYRDFKEGTTK